MSDVPDVSYKNFPGEYNAVNPAVTPPGAAQLILNGVVRNHGVLEPVRGFSTPTFTGSSAPTSIGVIDAARFTLLGPQDNTTPATGSAPSANGSMMYLDNLGNVNSLTLSRKFGWDAGVQNPSTGYNLSSFAAQRQGYVMTSRGLAKVELQNTNLDGTGSVPIIYPTALPTMPTSDIGVVAIGTVTGTYGVVVASGPAQNYWLPANYAVAYRLVIARKDPVTQQVRYGEPSSRIIVYNTGSAAIVRFKIFFPVGFPPDAFIQLYRSLAVPPNIAPSDEMYLVTELTPPATFESGPLGTFYWGYFPRTTGDHSPVPALDYDDITPGRVDDLANAQIYVPLYTNSGLGNGAQARKVPAPLANVVGYFQGRAYYGDISTQQTLQILLAGEDLTGSNTGLSPGDTVTVDGVVYTAVTNAGAVLTNQFQIFDSAKAATFGYPATLSSAIRLTSISLMGAINTYYTTVNQSLPLDNVVQVDYLSTEGGSGNQGQILLRRPRPGSPPFTVKTSRTQGWAQDYTAGVSSTNSPVPGGVIWSDLNQPESCPLGNQIILGSPASRVVGFVPLRDFAIIFKEDGAYIVRETTRGPQFSPLDTTVHLVAPRTAVALGNECYALTAQGVVRIYEGGVDNVSIPIQREILGYLQRSQGLFQGAFAVGYEAEREYWLALPSSGTLTQADLVKVYNTKTQGWTTVKTGTLTCGAEVPTSSSVARIATTALALGVNGNYGSGSNPSYVGWLLENKSQTNNDYAGTTVTPALTAIGSNNDGTYQVSAPPAWNGIITVGSLVRCPSDAVQKTYTVASVGLKADQSALLINLNLMVTSTVPVLTSASIQPAIVTTIRFMPEDAGKPLLEKHWAGIYLWHRYWNGSFMSTAWETEKTPFPVAGTEAGPGAPIPAGSAPASLSGMEPWCFRPWLKQPWMCPAQDYVLSTSMQGDFTRSGILVPTLTYYNALSRFELSQITFNVDGVSDRIIIS